MMDTKVELDELDSMELAKNAITILLKIILGKMLKSIYRPTIFEIKKFETHFALLSFYPHLPCACYKKNMGTSEELQKNDDEFTNEFIRNRIKMTKFQKILLSAGSSISALLDPRRHDMIACLGETTGEEALMRILRKMKADEEGRRILERKPRINTRTIDIEKLRMMPVNTFGHVYVKFLDDNNITPDSRREVRFMDDPELAYVMTRYRECHDMVHALLDMPTNMLGEVAVKWVEALNNGLPMCYSAAIFGALRLKSKQRKQYLRAYLPWALRNGKNAKFLMTIFWEERWQQDINEMRKELKIEILEV